MSRYVMSLIGLVFLLLSLFLIFMGTTVFNEYTFLALLSTYFGVTFLLVGITGRSW